LRLESTLLLHALSTLLLHALKALPLHTPNMLLQVYPLRFPARARQNTHRVAKRLGEWDRRPRQFPKGFASDLKNETPPKAVCRELLI
jgi:hypothetical protein